LSWDVEELAPKFAGSQEDMREVKREAETERDSADGTGGLVVLMAA
jgi:hypothetical protein